MPATNLTDDRLRIIIRNRIQQGPFVFAGFDKQTGKMVGPFIEDCTTEMLDEAIIALNAEVKKRALELHYSYGKGYGPGKKDKNKDKGKEKAG